MALAMILAMIVVIIIVDELSWDVIHDISVGLTTFVLQNVSSSFISSKKLCVSNSFFVFMHLNNQQM